MNRPVPYGSCIRAGPGFLPNLASVIARAGNPGPAFCFTEPRRGRGAGQDAQFPCESRVLLPGCGLLPLVTSFPGLFVLLRGGLLFPGLPVALGAIRSSNSSTSSRTCSFILFHLLSVVLDSELNLSPRYACRRRRGTPCAGRR